MSDQQRDQQKRPKLKPELPSGFRDYLPPEAIAKNRMLATLRRVCEQFGFDPLETPAIERKDVLTGNDRNFRMIIYETQTTAQRAAGEPVETALRYDLTVPLARVVAANRDLKRPFKRYQTGSVWRGERAQAGRYREFQQFDFDSVGTASPLADAEIVALVVEALRAIGAGRFTVHMNTRAFVNGLAAYAGFDAALAPGVLRTIDKLSKIGRDAVLRELAIPMRVDVASNEEDDATESRSGLGLLPDSVARIGMFLDLQGTTDEVLATASAMFSGIAVAEDGIRELRAIVHSLRAMRVPEEHWVVDVSIARGLSYYTGFVFETFLTEAPSFGSICSGGRYDDLVARFADQHVPAVGGSIGVDRLFAVMESLRSVTMSETMVEAFVAMFDDEGVPDALAMVGVLRKAGVRTLLWLGKVGDVKEQLAYASAKGIPVVVLSGSDERAASTITVKDMRSRTQVTVPHGDLISTVRDVLARTG